MKKILIIEDDTVLRENTAEFIKAKLRSLYCRGWTCGRPADLKAFTRPYPLRHIHA
jgi:GR25 family glycosyltransferase involved in LPS biosynthesis